MNVQMHPKREALRRTCMQQIALDTKKVMELTARLEAPYIAQRAAAQRTTLCVAQKAAEQVTK
jgi:hypothetical protein